MASAAASPLAPPSVSATHDVFVSESGRDSAAKSPLVLLLGFWGAQPRILQKYADLFNAEGHDVVMGIAPYAGVLTKNPLVLRPYVIEVLEQVKARVAGRRVAVMAMSNGGCFPLQHLLRLAKEGHPCTAGVDFAGVCYDSSPAQFDVGNIARAAGLAGGGGIVGGGLWAVAYLLLSIIQVADSAGLFGDEGIERFNYDMRHAKPLGPELFVYSTADDLTACGFVESVVAARRAIAGHDVRAVNFETSPHVGHLRAHPVRYREEIRGWLAKL